MKDDKYYQFLENLNQLFKKEGENQKQQEEIERRFKVLVFLFKNKEYYLIETMLNYYLSLEVYTFGKIIKK